MTRFRMKGVLQKIVDVRAAEVRALWLGFAFHFLILTAYYIIKPIRDSIAASNRLETLPWMFAATLIAIVCFLVRFFPNNFTEGNRVEAAREQPIGGTAWSGITHIARSPYLFGLAAAIMFYTTTSTWAYFQQTTLAGQALKASTDRTVFLSNLEIWVNTITLFIQVFLTGRLLKWFGVAFTLISLPFLSMLGFAAMAIAPSLSMLAFFQVTRRAAAYALMRPSREILFTVLRREDKYKVKSVTDTLGYRVGDQLGAWSYGGLGPNGLHLSLNAISWLAVPVTAGWCALSLWLARKQRALADAQTKSAQSAPLSDISAAETA